MSDQELDVSKMNKEDLFVNAYIANKFNATAAAREVFNLGSQGGKDNDGTARSMGSEYLAKPNVQKKLKARMEREDLSVEWIANQLKMIAASKGDKLRIEAIDRLAHLLGAEIKEKQATQGLGSGVNINLSLPTAPEGQQLPKGVVDAEVIEE